MKRSAIQSVLFITVLALGGLACQAVTSLVSKGGGAPSLLKDDFSDKGSGWGTGTDADSSIEYVSGGLHEKVLKPNFFTWSNPDRKNYQNVHMEVTVKNQTGSTRAAFGMLCNQQVPDSSYYYFAVTSAGEYVIAKSATGKDDLFLTNNNTWATSNVITKDAPSYRLGADCGPSALTLYVDGKKVDSVTDNAYADGEIGLFIWSGETPGGEVTFDDFVMTQLK